MPRRGSDCVGIWMPSSTKRKLERARDREAKRLGVSRLSMPQFLEIALARAKKGT